MPWQIVAQKTGAILKFVDLTADEVPDTGMLREMISEKTKLVVAHHVSNVLGRLKLSNFEMYAYSIVHSDICFSLAMF